MGKKIKKKTTGTEDEKHPLPIYNKEDDIYSQAKEVPLEESTNPFSCPSVKNYNVSHYKGLQR